MAALVPFLRRIPEQPAEAVRAGLADPAALVEAAARHGLSGFVHHAIESAGATLDPPAGEHLRRDALGARAKSAQVRKLLDQSLDALAEAGVTPVVLKGTPLAERLYGDAAHRASTDVDLWVLPEQAPRAQAALTKLGLTASAENEPHHVALKGTAGIVELHVLPGAPFGRPFAGQPLWQRAAIAAIDYRNYLRLAPDDELLYLSVHAANHLLQRLAWLYDLKLLVRAEPQLDWDRLARTARQTHVGAFAFYALEAARRLIGAAVPDEALVALRPRSWKTFAAQHLFTEERLEDGYFATHKAAWVGAKVALAPSYASLASVAWQRLLGFAHRG